MKKFILCMTVLFATASVMAYLPYDSPSRPDAVTGATGEQPQKPIRKKAKKKTKDSIPPTRQDSLLQR